MLLLRVKLQYAECDYDADLVLSAASKRIKDLEKSCNKDVQSCWDAVHDMIITGDTSGNGTDKRAEKNGIVLALNTITRLMK